MATKLRLQRHGKKGKPYYHLVVADSRSKRDGRYIERLGSYDPNTNPATIKLAFDKTLDWVQKGAQPTDSVRAILSYKGILYKNHLLKGVTKGALTLEQVEAKFQDWVDAKQASIDKKVDALDKTESAALSKQLSAEKAQNEARAKAIAAAEIVEETEVTQPEGETKTVETSEAEEATEVQTEEKTVEEAKSEEPAAEVKEEKKEEVKAEEKKEEVKEAEVKAEAKTEDKKEG